MHTYMHTHTQMSDTLVVTCTRVPLVQREGSRRPHTHTHTHTHMSLVVTCTHVSLVQREGPRRLVQVVQPHRCQGSHGDVLLCQCVCVCVCMCV
jgi:hypothetical protein